MKTRFIKPEEMDNYLQYRWSLSESIIKSLNKYGKTVDDVVWVGSKDGRFSCDWNTFARRMGKVNIGMYGEEICNDLVIVLRYHFMYRTYDSYPSDHDQMWQMTSLFVDEIPAVSNKSVVPKYVTNPIGEYINIVQSHNKKWIYEKFNERIDRHKRSQNIDLVVVMRESLDSWREMTSDDRYDSEHDYRESMCRYGMDIFSKIEGQLPWSKSNIDSGECDNRFRLKPYAYLEKVFEEKGIRYTNHKKAFRAYMIICEGHNGDYTINSSRSWWFLFDDREEDVIEKQKRLNMACDILGVDRFDITER